MPRALVMTTDSGVTPDHGYIASAIRAGLSSAG